MQEDRKKEEHDILRCVFSNSKIYKVTESEEPDFIVEIKDLEFRFGVEVTKLFVNESSARLKNIDNYANNIIKENKYKHKDDKKSLPIVNMESIPNGNEEKLTIKGIHITEYPNTKKMIQRLVEAIEGKNKKAPNYNRDLGAIDLIIYDMENNYNNIESQDIYDYFFTSNMELVLKATMFREVYFITTFKSKERVFLMLKSQMIIKKLFIYIEMLKKYYPEYILSGSDSVLRSFYFCMKNIGIEEIYYSIKGVPAIYYSHIKITFPNYNIFIREIQGSIPNNMALLKDNGYYSEKGLNKLTVKFLDFERKKTLKTPLEFKVKTKNDNIINI